MIAEQSSIKSAPIYGTHAGMDMNDKNLRKGIKTGLSPPTHGKVAARENVNKESPSRKHGVKCGAQTLVRAC